MQHCGISATVSTVG